MAFDSNYCERSSRLGEMLIRRGLINSLQLQQGLSHQHQNKRRLGESLIKLGFVDKDTLSRVLTRQRRKRALFAGIIMCASPINFAWASDEPEVFRYSPTQSAQDEFSSHYLNQLASDTRQVRAQNNFIMGVKYRVSLTAGIEVGIAKDHFNDARFHGQFQKAYVPQVSLFTYYNDSPNKTVSFSRSNKQRNAIDSYKHSLPTVFRLTLKGYSIFESAENKSYFFGLDKVEEASYRNFELMLSVTKRF